MRASLSSRFRRILAALLMSAALVAGPLAPQRAEAVTEPERRLIRLINLARHRYGIPPVRVSDRMSQLARRHSARMAQVRELSHRCPRCLLDRYGWSAVGENVGWAGTVYEAHRLLLGSASHKAHILCPCYTRVGVGVVRSGGRVWVTEFFYRP